MGTNEETLEHLEYLTKIVSAVAKIKEEDLPLNVYYEVQKMRNNLKMSLKTLNSVLVRHIAQQKRQMAWKKDGTYGS